MEQQYGEEHIKSLDWKDHIRLRPGMYIGKLGDGTQSDDGIYILIKEIIDNSVDEYVMGKGSRIEITADAHHFKVRDYGRGIPLTKVVECVSQINTGGKYGSGAFKKSVGLNGVGTKAVNALSERFIIRSWRAGVGIEAEFKAGILVKEKPLKAKGTADGTEVEFTPDSSIFKGYSFDHEIVEQMLKNYAYLNPGMKLHFNDKIYVSENGLLDLLREKTETTELRYPIIHLKGEDIEIALSHSEQFGEEHYSFVNGQHTSMGGTHQIALREGIVKAVRDFFKKDYDTADIRSGLIASIALRVDNPVFESQTKTKLGSQTRGDDGPSLKGWIIDFLKETLDNYLHMEPETAQALQKKILQSERERKEMQGIRKIAQDRAKKANVFNKKLRDCRVHRLSKDPDANLSTLFITEGDSASGSLTKARNVRTQAVFSLRGKPLNCFGMSKKIVYENEEFNLLQHALQIEDGIEGLRYQRIVLATDADVDGLHIRLLLMTFFLQFFPELVKANHLFILKTPLFRVRDKQKTVYAYDEREKNAALKKFGKKPEITRFKGLGEISPDEFGQFIGDRMRLEPIRLSSKSSIIDLLTYYMGKNTQDRQKFIIDHLRTEDPIDLEAL
ncbi:MAG: type IIA DNA topoisomerase subunit B [Chitinophagaceae bacterium]|nr:type IIA DNA topoisomerase subunit B [Oligoflexus sp.]